MSDLRDGKSAGPGGHREIFARIFRDEFFRFDFGMRRGDCRWFELGHPDRPVLAERRRIIRESPHEALLWLPEAAPLLAETLALLGETPSPPVGPADLTGLAARWEPDLLLLNRDAAGEFRLAGGAVCFPSFWNPAEKLGRPVDEIHAPVPTLNVELGPRIRTFLARLPAGVVFERENWGLAAGSEASMHPQRGRPRLETDTPLDGVWLRLEEQMFRALPQSSGVLFLIRLTVHPLRAVLAEPSVRVGFLRLLATMPEEVAAYKGLSAVRSGLQRQIQELR